MGKKLLSQGYIVQIIARYLSLIQLAIPFSLIIKQQVVKVLYAIFEFIKIEKLVHFTVAKWPQDITFLIDAHRQILIYLSVRFGLRLLYVLSVRPLAND